LNNSVYPPNTVADLSCYIIKELVLKIVPGIPQFQRGEKVLDMRALEIALMKKQG
jgi:hypothetical protein